jgi:hypothetical protein
MLAGDRTNDDENNVLQVRQEGRLRVLVTLWGQTSFQDVTVACTMADSFIETVAKEA